jgi:influenza virus NS1A-binding protein
LAAAPLADGIYAIGGYSGSDYLASVEKYEEGSHEWVEVASLKKARCTHSAASVFDSQEILVSGGFD